MVKALFLCQCKHCLGANLAEALGLCVEDEISDAAFAVEVGMSRGR